MTSSCGDGFPVEGLLHNCESVGIWISSNEADNRQHTASGVPTDTKKIPTSGADDILPFWRALQIRDILGLEIQENISSSTFGTPFLQNLLQNVRSH